MARDPASAQPPGAAANSAPAPTTPPTAANPEQAAGPAPAATPPLSLGRQARGIAALVTLLGLGVLLWPRGGDSTTAAPAGFLLDATGRAATLGSHLAPVTLVHFWATWCPPCIEELPSLNEFQQRYANAGVVVLAVSIDSDEKAYRNFLSRARLSFLTARDPDKKISADYGTIKVPESYIIDRNGKVIRKLISNQDWMSERMTKDVESLL
jgi:thiol-disulfide isomerase/thioredoxin